MLLIAALCAAFLQARAQAGPCPANDVDCDGIVNTIDNCPDVANPGQEDAEGEGVDDVCDPGSGDRSSLGRHAAEGGTCFLPLVMGDMTGGQTVESTDALWILRKNAGLPLPNGGHACSPEDVDCNGARNAVDALKILRYVVGLEVQQTEPCVNIGDEIPP
jgi:hypothetical protein